MSKIYKKTQKIKVLGIGGGGNNAVNQMINSHIEGADYYLINTEKGILERANTNGCKTLQIGREVAQGLGAGANPEVGEKAARESLEEINKILDGCDLVFLTAGTTPFKFEGKLRGARANLGIQKLKGNVNSLIVISNDKLLANTDSDVSILNAFKLTDDILRQAIESITDLIYSVGTINVDFADVKTVLSYEGLAYMGIGSDEGLNKIESATKKALENPLTERKISKAKGVIFNIKGSEDIGLDDINRSAEIIAEKVSPDANIIFGTVIDEDLGDKVVVTVVATGVEEEEKEGNKNDNKRF